MSGLDGRRGGLDGRTGGEEGGDKQEEGGDELGRLDGAMSSFRGIEYMGWWWQGAWKTSGSMCVVPRLEDDNESLADETKEERRGSKEWASM